MSRERDPIGLSSQWHIDVRIVSELPEDNVVGRRFIVNVVSSAVTLAMVLFTVWLGYLNLTIRHQTSDWEGRIAENRPEVAEIKHMQQAYAIESAKIDQAFALMKPQIFVSRFVSDLGRTRPEQVVIDTIDWSDAGVIVRGNVRENSQRAALLLRDYSKQLVADQKIGPLFKDIALTSLDRGAGMGVGTVTGGGTTVGELLNFELTFRLKEKKP